MNENIEEINQLNNIEPKSDNDLIFMIGIVIIWFFANEYATKENLKLQILSVLEDVRELKKTTKPVL